MMNAHTKPESAALEADPRALRDVLGQFATGVTVITTTGENGAPVGMAANSFASVSLDPPLVVWSLALKSPSLSAFRRSGTFAINIMCDQSKDLALQFSRPSPDKFAGVDWREGVDGCPVLDGAAAVLQCRTQSRIPGGDHEMYLGRVIQFTNAGKRPLIFHQGSFAEIGTGL
jgi:flavin reductase (DIM6/NTAB) family NADH-FMN oxidoreductase RutF